MFSNVFVAMVHYQLHTYEMGLKKRKHVKFGRILYSKYTASLVTYFPIIRAICEYHVSKNLPLLLRTIHWAIFSHLRTNQSASHQVRDSSMQTIGNWKVPSPVSKPHGVELHSWVIPTCCEPILPLWWTPSWRKITLCCFFRYFCLFWSIERFKSINCCWQRLVLTVSPGFNNS